MNKPHPIDDLFKQQLGQSSADVPTDMWDRISSEIGEEKHKPKAFWLWSSIGILFITAGVLIAGQFLSSDTHPTNINTPILEQSRQTLLQNDKAQVSQQLETTPIHEQITHTDHTPSINQDNETASATQTTAAKFSTKGQTNIQQSIAPLKGKTQNQILPTLDISIEPPIQSKSQKVITDEPYASAILDNEESAISGPHQRQYQSVVKNIPNLNFGLSATQEIKLFEKSKTSCARFNNPFFHLDLEMLLGPAYAHQQLSALASESTVHLGERLESESSGLSYSAGVRLAATSNVGLGLRTGITYSQINDIYKYEVGSRMQIDLILNANEEIIRRDTTYLEAYTENHQNNLKFVEVPLLVGYETRVGKFRVGVNAGAYLNLLFDAKGQISSPLSEEPINFGQVGESNVLPIFNKRASAAWYVGASVAYNLHSRYSLIAEPYFKTFPRALSAPDYDLKQNYWTVGMQLGLRMRL